MPRVTAFRCPFTNKLFPLTQRDNYIDHLKRLRKRHAAIRERVRARRNWSVFIESGRQTVSSLEELGRWLIDNSGFIGAYSRATHSVPPTKAFKIKEVKFILPRYSSSCSNSHSAPVGKKTNWAGRNNDKDLPRGYPGIDCQLELTVEGTRGSYMGDIFSSVNIYLGTGGGRGHGKFHHSSVIWLEDWPRLEESITMAVLKDDLNLVSEILVTETP